jgi:hypothetical protein
VFAPNPGRCPSANGQHDRIRCHIPVVCGLGKYCILARFQMADDMYLHEVKITQDSCHGLRKIPESTN